MASDTKKAWDERLLERWARQARDTANDPHMRKTPSFGEQIRSPLYWMATAASGIGILISQLSNSSAGTIAFLVGYVVFLVVTALDIRRWRRRQAP
jgi:hypothetical protein